VRVVLTLQGGGSVVIRFVEGLWLVAATTVAIKTFGNEPALTRGVVAFTAEYETLAGSMQVGETR
jgi:hypothetical protein